MDGDAVLPCCTVKLVEANISQCLSRGMFGYEITPPKTNIDTKNDALETENVCLLSTWRHFGYLCLISWGVSVFFFMFFSSGWF